MTQIKLSASGLWHTQDTAQRGVRCREHRLLEADCSRIPIQGDFHHERCSRHCSSLAAWVVWPGLDRLAHLYGARPHALTGVRFCPHKLFEPLRGAAPLCLRFTSLPIVPGDALAHGISFPSCILGLFLLFCGGCLFLSEEPRLVCSSVLPAYVSSALIHTS